MTDRNTVMDTTPGTVLTATGRSLATAASAAAALAAIGGASDPIAEVVAPTSCIAWLRAEDIYGRDASYASSWRSVVGPDMSGNEPAVIAGGASWINDDPPSVRPVYQTTGGVREIRFQGWNGGAIPTIPSIDATSFSACCVVVGAQLTGVMAGIMGWGQGTAGRNANIVSRINSKSAIAFTADAGSTASEALAILDVGTAPMTTAATAILVTYNGTTVSLYKALAADSAWVLVGTLATTLDIGSERPLVFGRTASGSTPSLSTVGFRFVCAHSAVLSGDEMVDLRAYFTTKGLL